MLKSTINCNHTVGIIQYSLFIDFLKKKNDGYTPNKAYTFSRDGYRGLEMTNVKIDEITDTGKEFCCEGRNYEYLC